MSAGSSCSGVGPRDRTRKVPRSLRGVYDELRLKASAADASPLPVSPCPSLLTSSSMQTIRHIDPSSGRNLFVVAILQGVFSSHNRSDPGANTSSY